MTGHLLLISIGPVQEFIAQARRSRDLWFGSHALSEIGRAVARALVRTDGGVPRPGVRLVFPALEPDDPELEPCDGPIRERSGADHRPPLSIANKILAEAESGVDVAELAAAARAAAESRWSELATKTRDRISELLADGHEAVWREQIETLLEFTALACPDRGTGEDSPRRRLDRALAGRKSLREFCQWQQTLPGSRKSSLDGARVSVLASRERLDEIAGSKGKARDLLAGLRLGVGEQLDAIGLVKRAGGEPQQFVPLTNVALAAWIELLAASEPDLLSNAAAACKAAGLGRVWRPDLPWLRWSKTAPEAWDAEVFLRGRWAGILRESRYLDDEAIRANRHEEWGRQHVAPALDIMSEPFPYVACLVADGDAMGRTLDALGDRAAHRQFSRELARFAAAAQDVLARHKGFTVYAGGDDVLGFVCLTEALACADALRACFAEVVATALPAGVAQPSLSVGIGVGHVLDGMGFLLGLGREAERLAKSAHLPAGEARNALAVVLDKRSGGRVEWRQRWGEHADNPVARLERVRARLATGELPTGKVYELRELLRTLPAPAALAPDAGAGFQRTLACETARILARAGGTAGALTLEDVDLRLEGLAYDGAVAAVDRWVAGALVARALVDARPTARSRPPAEAAS